MTIDDRPVAHLPAGSLRLAPHLRADVLGETTLVVGEDGVTCVRGRAASGVLPLLDGTRHLEAVVADAPPDLTAADVRSAVGRLVAAGIVDADPGPLGSRRAFFRAVADVGVTTDVDVRVGVVDLGDETAANAVVSALRAADLEVVADAPEADCVVVVVTDHLDPRLADLDTALREAGTAWLPVRAGGRRQWIGPFVGAVDDGPCWHCLAARLWGHRRAEEAFQASRGRVGPLERTLPTHPATLGMVAHAAALEVDAWAHGLERPVARGVVVHDQRAGDSVLHRLHRRPQCAACGDPGSMTRRGGVPVDLGHESSDRARRPGLEAGYGHLVSPVTGVVAVLADGPAPMSGTHLARTGPTPPARPLPEHVIRAWARMGNGGAGATVADARSAALGEALERWSGQFHGDEPRRRARRIDLGDEAVDPRDVLLVEPRQSADHSGWNAVHGPFNQIGPEVDDTEEIEWTPVWSLRDGRRRLLPTAMLYHGAPGPAWALADSNGCAAGPDLAEAVRRGLLELVERDAVALWWYHRTRMPAVEIDDAVRDAHASLGRQVWAHDLTADLGIPVIAAISARREAGDRVMLGFAADPDPGEAAARALRELAAGTGAVLDGAPTPTDPDARRWFEEVDVAREAWLRPHGTSTPGAVAGGVRAVVDRLVGHGLDPMVLDQTRPDVGLPVVRTIVPTLRPMWGRLAPGRLFDVPLALGRRGVAERYEDLNPRTVFL